MINNNTFNLETLIMFNSSKCRNNKTLLHIRLKIIISSKKISILIVFSDQKIIKISMISCNKKMNNIGSRNISSRKK